MDSKALTESWPTETPSGTHQEGQHPQSRALWAVVAHEVSFTYQVIRRDMSSAVMPGLIFGLAAWHGAGGPALELVPQLGRALLYFTLYAFTFCLSNQLMGVEEDRINKPDRPLARGMVSLRGASIRWVLAMLWQAVTIVHNLLRGARNWFIKNLSMGLGVWASLEAGWRIASPTMPQGAHEWLIFLAVSVFLLVPLQDLRDIQGDKDCGRKTFPMVFGITATRRFLGAGFAALAVLTHLLMMRLVGAPATMAGASPQVLVFDALLALTSLMIAFQVLTRHRPEQDHKTYMHYTYWYCLALASTFVLV